MREQWLKEFLPYPHPANEGPVEYVEVIKRLTQDDLINLAWPKNTNMAKAIYTIVTHPTNIPQDIYQKLEDLQTSDLRPHLLMLLKGFQEDNQVFKISRSLFETIHLWTEFKISQHNAPTSTDNVMVISINNDLSCLQLNETQKIEIKQRVAANTTATLAEKVIFLNWIDEGFVLERAYAMLHIMSQLLTQNQFGKIDRLLQENVRFLENCGEIFKIDSLAKLVKSFQYWITVNESETVRPIAMQMKEQWAAPRGYPDNIKHDEFDAQRIENVAQEILSLPRTAPQREKLRARNANFSSLHVMTTLFAYDTFPLLNYHYAEKYKNWLVSFPGPAILPAYFATTGSTPIDMIYCYGKIQPKEILDLRLAERRRLGNVSPCSFVKPKPEKIHRPLMAYFVEKIFHDRYHQYILAAIPDECEKILMRWIKTIQEKTGFSISKETWYLADSEFSGLFLAKNDIEKFHILFQYAQNGLSKYRPISIILSMVILDMLIHNAYNITAANFDTSPSLVEFYKLQKYFKLFLSIHEKCSANMPPVTAFIATSIVIFGTLRDQKDKYKFTNGVFLNNMQTLTYKWQKKENPGQDDNNTIQLHLAFHGKPNYRELSRLTDDDIKPAATTLSAKK